MSAEFDKYARQHAGLLSMTSSYAPGALRGYYFWKT